MVSPVMITPSSSLTAPQRSIIARVHDGLDIFPSRVPVVRFGLEACALIRKLAAMRRKDWRSTDSWNRLADETGLFGEWAVQRYVGIPAADVIAGFEAGLMGDAGHDLVSNGLTVDVKSTRGRALRYKFSRSNANRDTAQAVAFCYVEDGVSQAWAYLLGWAYWHEIAPRLREDKFCRFVRYQTLKNAGVIRPVASLKSLQKGGDQNNGEI